MKSIDMVSEHFECCKSSRAPAQAARNTEPGFMGMYLPNVFQEKLQGWCQEAAQLTTLNDAGIHLQSSSSVSLS